MAKNQIIVMRHLRQYIERIIMSKGSKPRPLSVGTETFNANWDKIFSKKKTDVINKKKSPKKDTKHAGIQNIR
jgi:hypothetical protein